MAARLNSRMAYGISLAVFSFSFLLLRLWRIEEATYFSREDFGSLPLTIGGWEGEDLPIPKRAREMLGTPNIIFRRYRKEGLAVNLYILESATNRASFHPPEYCYVGGRTEMVERGLRSLSGEGEAGTAHRFVFAGPRGNSLVYYWYSFGRRFVNSYYRQQFLIVLHRLLGRSRPALLIRLSLEGEFDLENGDGILEEFIREVFPALKTYLLTPKNRA